MAHHFRVADPAQFLLEKYTPLKVWGGNWSKLHDRAGIEGCADGLYKR